MYELTDVLDKSIRNIVETDMQLLIGTIRNVRSSGWMILQKYNKEAIIARERESITYTSRTELQISLFSEIYDEFQLSVIETADAFLSAIDHVPSHSSKEFYTI